jgi:hypothetical protein
MVTDDNTTVPGSQPEPQQAVLTLSPRHRSGLSDDEFARIKRSIEHSLDQIDEFIERYWSFGTGTPTDAITNR